MVSKRFLAKRLTLLVPVLLGVATLVFTILHASANDPAIVIVGQRASQEQVEQVQDQVREVQEQAQEQLEA